MELAQVVSNYQRILESSLTSSTSYMSESFKTISSLQTLTPAQTRIQNQKMAIHDKIGGELFDHIYSYLLTNRS